MVSAKLLTIVSVAALAGGVIFAKVAQSRRDKSKEAGDTVESVQSLCESFDGPGDSLTDVEEKFWSLGNDDPEKQATLQLVEDLCPSVDEDTLWTDAAPGYFQCQNEESRGKIVFSYEEVVFGLFKDMADIPAERRGAGLMLWYSARCGADSGLVYSTKSLPTSPPAQTRTRKIKRESPDSFEDTELTSCVAANCPCYMPSEGDDNDADNCACYQSEECDLTGCETIATENAEATCARRRLAALPAEPAIPTNSLKGLLSVRSADPAPEAIDRELWWGHSHWPHGHNPHVHMGTGSPCVHDSSCKSGRCRSICLDKVKTWELCAIDVDCLNWPNDKCIGIMTESKCRPLLAIGQTCHVDASCASNNCLAWKSVCAKSGQTYSVTDAWKDLVDGVVDFFDDIHFPRFDTHETDVVHDMGEWKHTNGPRSPSGWRSTNKFESQDPYGCFGLVGGSAGNALKATRRNINNGIAQYAKRWEGDANKWGCTRAHSGSGATPGQTSYGTHQTGFGVFAQRKYTKNDDGEWRQKGKETTDKIIWNGLDRADCGHVTNEVGPEYGSSTGGGPTAPGKNTGAQNSNLAACVAERDGASSAQGKQHWNEYRPTKFSFGDSPTDIWLYEPCNGVSGLEFDRAMCRSQWRANLGKTTSDRSEELDMSMTMSLLATGNVFYHGGGCVGATEYFDTVPIDLLFAYMVHMVHPGHGPVSGITKRGSSYDFDNTASIIHLLSGMQPSDFSYDGGRKFHPFEMKLTVAHMNTPDMMSSVSTFVRRILNTCSVGCLPFMNTVLTEIGTVLGDATVGSSFDYDPERCPDGSKGCYLAGHFTTCMDMLGVGVEFFMALLWQENVLGLGAKGIARNAQCGWDAGGMVYNKVQSAAGDIANLFTKSESNKAAIRRTFQASNKNYQQHAHWHWAATDVITNFYGLAKTVKQTYVTCEHNAGAKKVTSKWPATTGGKSPSRQRWKARMQPAYKATFLSVGSCSIDWIEGNCIDVNTGSYRNNLNCVARVQVQNGGSAILEVKRFDVEPAPGIVEAKTECVTAKNYGNVGNENACAARVRKDGYRYYMHPNTYPSWGCRSCKPGTNTHRGNHLWDVWDVYDPPCDFDYVEAKGKRFCGQDGPQRLVVSDGDDITFHADGGVNGGAPESYQGFRICFTDL